MELDLEFKPLESNIVTLVVRGIKIVYDAKALELNVNGHRVLATLRNGRQRIQIFTDRTAFEIFASDGLSYIPFPVIPNPDDLGVKLSVEGEAMEFSRLTAYELNSIWTTSK